MRLVFLVCACLGLATPVVGDDGGSHSFAPNHAFSVELPCPPESRVSTHFDATGCGFDDAQFLVYDRCGASGCLGLSDARDDRGLKFDRIVTHAVEDDFVVPPQVAEVDDLRSFDATAPEGDLFLRVRIIELADGELALLTGVARLSELSDDRAETFFNSFERTDNR
ncbi:MAG: hypothetical protein WA948_09815 [Pontixanthobacter sp.]